MVKNLEVNILCCFDKKESYDYIRITWPTLILKQGICFCKLQIVSIWEPSIVHFHVNWSILRMFKSLQNLDPRIEVHVFPLTEFPFMLEGVCPKEHLLEYYRWVIALLVASGEHCCRTVEIL